RSGRGLEGRRAHAAVGARHDRRRVLRRQGRAGDVGAPARRRRCPRARRAVGDVWPEFACGGKEPATVRHALSHQAGVPAIRELLTTDDLWSWERMTRALAATEAWFEPGSRVVYHTNTYGHLIGELIRRASGLSPAAALRRLADPLDADVWYALPDDVQARCAEVIFETPPALRAAFERDTSSPDS